ncbi:protein mono-ADP-ribosyltransferase PARP10 [Dromaius novaehollandiae]|uniref:protein mono-ADP-ribosyltransferase PARP10 n=1 Tax=Dromaius novaehollandiae TaxID=8790 RepID=UPI0031202CA3
MSSSSSSSSSVLEVLGAPPELPEELLLLYFESRRSGGGPVRSCRRCGTRLLLTFESPQDAERVLRRDGHRVQGAELLVRPAAPWDPAAVLFRGLDPRTPPGLLELYVEEALSRGSGSYRLERGPARDQALVRLREPLGDAEFAAAAERVRRRGPEGAAVAVERVPQADSVVVRGAAPGSLSRDLLELYFESRRSGGGSVRGVRLLPGRSLAVVAFQEPAAAARVLQQPHRLRDVELEVSPYHEVLEPLQEAAVPEPELEPAGALPELEPAPEPAGTGEVHADVADAAPRRRLPAESGGMLPAVPRDEALVALEPGVLRFLQRHYQELLAGIAEVSLLPLEGSDVAGFRLSGEAGACGAAAEFLQSLAGTVASQTVTLRYPGVARFLLDEGGRSIVGELESRFQCVLDLGKVAWSPPDAQPELPELLPEDGPWDCPPAAPGSGYRELPDGTDGDEQPPSMEEIRELLAALRTDDDGGAAGDGEPPPALDEAAPGWSGASSDSEEDPSGEPEPGSTVPGEPWGPADGGDAAEQEEEEEEEEEAAAMLLAIQRSMESTGREEEELQRATRLSLRSYERERRAAAAEDPGLRAALEASLEEALPAADAARVTLYAAFERDVSALPRQLERALEARLRAEEVQSPRLRALPAACRRYLAQVRCAHAVHLRLRAGTATLHGFADYAAAAARDLRRLLARLPPAEPPPPGSARWVRWDAGGTAVPYAAPAATLLERAWRRRQRRLDVLFDGRPVAIDLERMEEYDVGAARALAISRSEPPADGARRSLLGPEEADLDEAVKLMPLAEDSEEFGEAVHHFCATLGDSRGKIRVTKVEKLIHPLLYKQYQLKKACMEKTCSARSVERVLFHGTTEQSSREICLHGFNRSFCGKNATLYGLGVYFAVNAALSVRDKYSPCSADGSKYVFMAKALTGDYAAGRKDMRAPPLKEASEAPLRYDSVVDNPGKPGIFVIFNDTQAYPQYLITCRHATPPA